MLGLYQLHFKFQFHSLSIYIYIYFTLILIVVSCYTKLVFLSVFDTNDINFNLADISHSVSHVIN